MASVRILRRVISSHKCLSTAPRQCIPGTALHFSTSSRWTRETTESHLPRVVNPSLWTSLIPKFLRRGSGRSTSPVQRGSRLRNPYTVFIFLAILVGSNAINTIALRNDLVNFSRKTNAKLEVLREVLQRVKRGEDVDVRKLLGTGNQQAEKEWEEVMEELEKTEPTWEGLQEKKRKSEAKSTAKKEAFLQKRAGAQTGDPKKHETASGDGVEFAATRDGDGRDHGVQAKFLM